MKKISVKLILLQWLALIFFINGIQRLYQASQYEKYNCLFEYMKNPESDCWDKFQSRTETLGDFMANRYYWALYGFVFGIIIITILNLRKKTAIINSMIVFVLTLLLFPIGFFKRGIANTLFNSFGGIFSENFGVENFIGGITFTIVGGLIIWRSVKE